MEARARRLFAAAVVAVALSSLSSCTTSQPAAPEPGRTPLVAVAPRDPARVAVPPGTGEPLPVKLTPSLPRGAPPDLRGLGKRVYGTQCAACHGVTGRGDGEAAYLLYPKPRDLTTG